VSVVRRFLKATGRIQLQKMMQAWAASGASGDGGGAALAQAKAGGRLLNVHFARYRPTLCKYAGVCCHNRGLIKWHLQAQMPRLQKPTFPPEALVLEFISKPRRCFAPPLLQKKIPH
jgi:hypothetical protein